jgi:hypothetical protein
MSIAVEPAAEAASAAGDRSRKSLWHGSAPRAVREAFEAGRAAAEWKAWRRHLRTRKRPLDPDRLLPGGARSLLWGPTASDAAASGDPDPRDADSERTAHSLHRWLSDASGGHGSREFALSALGWCRRLPRLSAVLSAGAWWRLFDQLMRTAVEAQATVATDPLVHQLAAGELALTLAYLFPEIQACRALVRPARRALSAGLVHVLDRTGLPPAEHFDRLPLWLACWTRCRALGARWKRGRWNARAEERYRRLVRSTLRLTRRDGTYVFSQPGADGCHIALLTASAPGKRNKPRRRRGQAGGPSAKLHSERAGLGVLRIDGLRSAPHMTVAYAGPTCHVELARGKEVLWSGPWDLEVRTGGVLAEAVSSWTELCWVSDDDVDYLELGLKLEEGLRVERHLLAARNEGFLWMADAVFAPQPSKIEYRSSLPLWPGVSFREACETREGMLIGRKPRAQVLPLALPEWLTQPGRGALASTAAGLELRQAAEARALFAPLWIDLDRSRLLKPLTWRSLAVGQQWAVVPADAAVGYRVAVGKRQWLFYRELRSSPQPRSVLGHHLRSEMLVARFHRSGRVEPLIEIESSDGDAEC